MNNHFDLTDLAFEQQFATAQTDSAIFNHEANLRLAWIHVEQYGIDAAISNFTSQLKSFIAHLGVPEK